MASSVQVFIDSQAGGVLATLLHTGGAIAYLAGLATYWVWFRHIQHGSHHARTLVTAAVATYFAIVANLLGGFMRTYQSDHPGLTAFGREPWVTVLVLKHLFLFVGMAASVYLLEVQAPRWRRAAKSGTLAKLPRGMHHAAIAGAVASIFVAAALGATLQAIPIPEPAVPEPGHVHGTDPIRFENATGQLTSTPAVPRAAGGEFNVALGTREMDATLTWTPTQFSLGFELDGPNGRLTVAPAAGGSVTGTWDGPPGAPPEAGSWSFVVSANDLAVAVDWVMSIRMPGIAEGATLLHNEVTIAPGKFYEINTYAEPGAMLNWDWTSDAAVHFNVHSHFDGVVTDWIDKDGTADEGSFDVERDGGYSYLWENRGSSPVHVDLQAWGAFELD